MNINDIKIDVFNKSYNPRTNSMIDDNTKYCAIVMIWEGKNWSKTDITIVDESPTMVFNRALAQVAKKGWWK